MQTPAGLDWNDLRYFLAIAREGTLAGAARALGVNHSTVFRRLQAFEQRLGVRVFDRTAEGYVATLEGEELRRHAETADAAVLALERTAAGRDYRLAGRVRLTTAPNLAAEYVAGYLPAFRGRHPDIVVEIDAGDHDFDLARREADLALRATPRPPEFLVGRKVLDLPWWVCAGRRLARRRDAPRGMDDVQHHGLIGATRAFLRLPVFAWLERRYPESAFVARAGDLNTMRAMAMAGLGLAILPIDQVAPGLEPLFPVEPRFDGQLWLLTHPDLRHVTRVKTFMAWLDERLRADPRLAPQRA